MGTHGFSKNPYPYPPKTRTRDQGYGFLWVRVRVWAEIPRGYPWQSLRVGDVWKDEVICSHNEIDDRSEVGVTFDTRITQAKNPGFLRVIQQTYSMEVVITYDRSSYGRPPPHIRTPVFTNFQTFADDRKGRRTKIRIRHGEEWNESGGKAWASFLRS